MDDDKDFDYVPPTESRTTLKNMTGVRQVLHTGYIFEEISHFVCLLFFFLFFADGFHFLFVKI